MFFSFKNKELVFEIYFEEYYNVEQQYFQFQ